MKGDRWTERWALHYLKSMWSATSKLQLVIVEGCHDPITTWDLFHLPRHMFCQMQYIFTISLHISNISSHISTKSIKKLHLRYIDILDMFHALAEKETSSHHTIFPARRLLLRDHRGSCRSLRDATRRIFVPAIQWYDEPFSNNCNYTRRKESSWKIEDV